MANGVKDLKGRRFGRLVVLHREGSKRGRALWLCQCDCGTRCLIVSGELLRTTRPGTLSCGCLQKEAMAESGRRNGPINGRKYGATNFEKARFKHGQSGTRLHRVWMAMLNRCTNPAVKTHHGRGIKVCEAWLDFQTFARDVGEIPFEGATLERINNDGNYEPRNVKWATRKEQANNSRMNRRLEHDGQNHTLTQWSEITGRSPKTITSRLRYGWSIERALMTPTRQHKEYRRAA